MISRYDNTTPFVCSQNLSELVKKLEENSDLAINWFKNNYEIRYRQMPHTYV